MAVAQYLQLATVMTASAWGYTKFRLDMAHDPAYLKHKFDHFIGKYPSVGVFVDGWTAKVWEVVVQPLVGQVGYTLCQKC